MGIGFIERKAGKEGGREGGKIRRKKGNPITSSFLLLNLLKESSGLPIIRLLAAGELIPALLPSPPECASVLVLLLYRLPLLFREAAPSTSRDLP